MAASWDPLPYNLIAQKIEPSARVVSKDHWFWTLVWVLGLILSLGILAALVPLSSWRRRAATVAIFQGHPHVPEDDTVAHEAGHNWQYQLLGWLFFPMVSLVLSMIFNWWFMLGSALTFVLFISRSFRAWVGAIPFLLIYFVIPFPIYLCYGRYRLELSAEKRRLKWMLESGNYSNADIMIQAKKFGDIVAGKQYGFPWPGFWVRWGFKRAAKSIIK